MKPVFGSSIALLASLSLATPALADVADTYGPSPEASTGTTAPDIVRENSEINGQQQQAEGALGEAISPSDVKAPLGATAQFSASVTNPSDDMKVKWQVSYDGKNWRDVPKGNTAKLSVVFLSDADNGTRYRAIFTRGNSTVTTDPATLTIGTPVDTSSSDDTSSSSSSLDTSSDGSSDSTTDSLSLDSSQAEVVSTSIESEDTKVNKWLSSHQNKMWIWNNSPYGAQCVDLFDYYFQDMTGEDPPMVEGAKDLWDMPGNIGTYFKQVPASETPQQGDVAIWGSSWGGGYGHVAIVIKSADDGNIQVLANNVDGSGSQPALVNNSSTSGLLGYLRPQKITSDGSFTASETSDETNSDSDSSASGSSSESSDSDSSASGSSSESSDSDSSTSGSSSESSDSDSSTSGSSSNNSSSLTTQSTAIQKLPWSNEIFAVGVNSQNTTVRVLTKDDLKYLDNPKVQTVKDIPGTEYYTGGKAGVIWGVTPHGDAVELTYDQWKKVGSPKPKKQNALYVRYSWDNQKWMAVPIDNGKKGILWKPLNQAEYAAEGSPKMQNAGYITGTTFYKSWSSDDVYARSASGKVHKLTYDEWKKAGSPKPQVIED
ncbi:MAG: CHAP domain-containing protein [Micrococcaceae bacterium]